MTSCLTASQCSERSSGLALVRPRLWQTTLARLFWAWCSLLKVFGLSNSNSNGHGGWLKQCRCQDDPVSLPSGRLEKTTRSSPHHVAQHYPTGSETTPPYAPRSSRFGSEPPSVEDDVDVWRYAIELHAGNDDDDDGGERCHLLE